ncbi:MAG: Na/Pi symporter [Atribacterota bacterium]|nr:Na/Pi symporter [Atribacterota bacterium]
MVLQVIGIFGSLIIFLYGLQKTNIHLRQAFGNKLQAWINKISFYPSLSIFFGIFLTFTMQSSTAATSLLVGLINTGMMTLYQALQILIGTSIGTTITTQIITFNIAQYSFILIILGYGLNILSKKKALSIFWCCIAGNWFYFSGNEPDFRLF